MWGIAGRSLGAFLFATFLLRLAGRKSVSQLNYFDFLMANLMGNMLGYYVAGSVKGAKLLVAPVVFITSGIFAEMAAVKSRTARKLLEGQALVLVKNGKLLERNMNQAHYNIGELLMELRQKNIFHLSEVEYAVLETNGKLSVQKKSQNRPVTPKDLGIPTKYEGLSSILVSDGQILEQNLKHNSLNRRWLQEQFEARRIKDVSRVFLASLATDGTLYIDLKDERGQ